jgi:hypothetical protein
VGLGVAWNWCKPIEFGGKLDVELTGGDKYIGAVLLSKLWGELIVDGLICGGGWCMMLVVGY